MREHTTPTDATVERGDHLVRPLVEHAQRRPQHPLFAYRDGDRFVDVPAVEALDRVRRLARGLIGLGIGAGERVALMSSTRLEWTLVDYAVLMAGAVTVPVYETSSPDQIEWIVANSGARAIVLETTELRRRYDEVADRLTDCEHVLVLDDDGLGELERAGADVTDDDLDERCQAITIDDLATIVYTSGTTGRPKGCRLTHGNVRWDVVQTIRAIGEMVGPTDSQLLFLPLAHVFARILLLACVETGAKVAFASSVDAITDEMPMLRPTYLAAVPRIFEKVRDRATQRAHDDGRGAIFDKAAEVATRWSQEQRDGGASVRLRLLHALFDRRVYAKLRDVFGGRLSSATSGGGPLGERLAHFFHGVGVRVYEGYGLTETGPVLTANHPGAWRIGTVGRPIPGTTIRIADDGEILAKGRQVFAGYHENEEATREVIDDDGWFHTGDLGSLDDDGFLRITGRKKEMIVTAAGKNVAPAVLEDRIRSHPLVSQAVVVGDDRRFVAALVTIDRETFPSWAEEHGRAGSTVDELVDDEELRASVGTAIDRANGAVSRAESIREFRILPDELTVEGGELTPTLKVKRRVVEERYGDLIEEIYA